jgi:hypothetical protein
MATWSLEKYGMECWMHLHSKCIKTTQSCKIFKMLSTCKWHLISSLHFQEIMEAYPGRFTYINKSFFSYPFIGDRYYELLQFIPGFTSKSFRDGKLCLALFFSLGSFYIQNTRVGMWRRIITAWLFRVMQEPFCSQMGRSSSQTWWAWVAM